LSFFDVFGELGASMIGRGWAVARRALGALLKNRPLVIRHATSCQSASAVRILKFFFRKNQKELFGGKSVKLPLYKSSTAGLTRTQNTAQVIEKIGRGQWIRTTDFLVPNRRLMSIFVFAFLIGVVAGLRAMTAPAAVSWAARLGWLPLENTWLAFLGFAATPYVISLLAVGELINDKLPKTPSRKAPAPFVARIIIGALCGAAMGVASQAFVGGLLAGALGAVAGTLGGYEFRTRLVRATGGNDLPIALLEDAMAIGGALLIVSRLS
jgi:uncharacterized membrane protein